MSRTSGEISQLPIPAVLWEDQLLLRKAKKQFFRRKTIITKPTKAGPQTILHRAGLFINKNKQPFGQIPYVNGCLRFQEDMDPWTWAADLFWLGPGTISVGFPRNRVTQGSRVDPAKGRTHATGIFRKSRNWTQTKGGPMQPGFPKIRKLDLESLWLPCVQPLSSNETMTLPKPFPSSRSRWKCLFGIPNFSPWNRWKLATACCLSTARKVRHQNRERL